MNYLEPISLKTNTVYKLFIEESFIRFESSINEIDAYLYNNMYPGPILEVELYSIIKLEIENNLSVNTSIHFHGVEVPFKIDGILSRLKPSQKTEINISFNTPGLKWFHSHTDQETQIRKGLYGIILVREPTKVEEENKLIKKFSDVYYNFNKINEHILVLDDIKFDMAGFRDDLSYKNFNKTSLILENAHNGVEGNILLLNGKDIRNSKREYFLEYDAPIRLRIVNVSASRIMKLKFTTIINTDEIDVWFLGTDGGFAKYATKLKRKKEDICENPIVLNENFTIFDYLEKLNSLQKSNYNSFIPDILSPGERIDILLIPSSPQNSEEKKINFVWSLEDFKKGKVVVFEKEDKKKTLQEIDDYFHKCVSEICLFSALLLNYHLTKNNYDLHDHHQNRQLEIGKQKDNQPSSSIGKILEQENNVILGKINSNIQINAQYELYELSSNEHILNDTYSYNSVHEQLNDSKFTILKRYFTNNNLRVNIDEFSHKDIISVVYNELCIASSFFVCNDILKDILTLNKNKLVNVVEFLVTEEINQLMIHFASVLISIESNERFSFLPSQFDGVAEDQNLLYFFPKNEYQITKKDVLLEKIKLSDLVFPLHKSTNPTISFVVGHHHVNMIDEGKAINLNMFLEFNSLIRNEIIHEGLMHKASSIDNILKDVESFAPLQELVINYIYDIEIENLMNSYHNFHIHGFRFQYVPLDEYLYENTYIAWKDTITIPPKDVMKKTKLRLKIEKFERLNEDILNKPWLIHCHINAHHSNYMYTFIKIIDEAGYLGNKKLYFIYKKQIICNGYLLAILFILLIFRTTKIKISKKRNYCEIYTLKDYYNKKINLFGYEYKNEVLDGKEEMDDEVAELVKDRS